MATWEEKKELTHLHQEGDDPLTELSILLDLDNMDPNEGPDQNPGGEKIHLQLSNTPGNTSEKTYQFGFMDKEEQDPDLKMRDWVPEPDKMILENLSSPELGLILSDDIEKCKSSLRLGPNAPDGVWPLANGPILPVITPWPLCQDHAAPSVRTILEAYWKGYKEQDLEPPKWLWLCQEDLSGNKCTMTQFLVPPLGQVTIRLFKNATVVNICQSVDPWENENPMGGRAGPVYRYECRIPCDPAYCFKVIWEGNIWDKPDQACWLIHLKEGHKFGANELSQSDIKLLEQSRPYPYGRIGECPKLQYAVQVKMRTAKAPLSSKVRAIKALNFHRWNICQPENPGIGEGFSPSGYTQALKAYGPQRGSVEERVWLTATKMIKPQEDAYWKDYWKYGYFPLVPNKQDPGWTRHLTKFKISRFSTPADIQKITDELLPKGACIMTTDGTKYISTRKVHLVNEGTLEEYKARCKEIEEKYGGHLSSDSDDYSEDTPATETTEVEED
ncbi:bet protein [Guenon simian foamy virus]|uniref:Bet protein n=1 Tax=Guenon simian foamy virus TaxID=2170197 RepID=K7ZBX6_9RETR|nr:bet protein [Guenon simian foamy virus]AFX98101.1 bet protein [Guenon simian foamy virus]